MVVFHLVKVERIGVLQCYSRPAYNEIMNEEYLQVKLDEQNDICIKWRVIERTHGLKQSYLPQLHGAAKDALSGYRVVTNEGSGHRVSGVYAPLVLLNNTQHN